MFNVPWGNESFSGHVLPRANGSSDAKRISLPPKKVWDSKKIGMEHLVPYTVHIVRGW